MKVIKGVGVSEGLQKGIVRRISSVNFKRDYRSIPYEKRKEEALRLQGAFEKALEQLRTIRKENIANSEVADILAAHIEIAKDPALKERVFELVLEEGRSGVDSLYLAVHEFSSAMEKLQDEYLRERAADIHDVGKRIYGILTGEGETGLNTPSVVVSDDLAPSTLSSLKKQYIRAIVSGTGGSTSHLAILAKGLGIPAIVGVGNAIKWISDGDMVIVDGGAGEIFIDPDEDTLRVYEEAIEKEAREQALMESTYVGEPALMQDGEPLHLNANVTSTTDGELARSIGMQGVGLYRTEFLFFDRETWPDEEEQFREYKSVLEMMNPLPVTVRTMDIGGDKALSYMDYGEEENPFLGYRALRVSLGNPQVFKTQLRALLRASEYGNMRIMFPMVSTLEEYRKAKSLLEECREELKAEKKPFADNIPVGAMIETPSAAVMANALAQEVDFFSIGTNDLIQYTMAVDRMNNAVSYLYDPLQPAVLMLIKFAIDAAHKGNIPVGMCGEMAGDPEALKLLVGMGLDEFSVAPGSLLKFKAAVSTFTRKEAEELAERCLKCRTAEEVRANLGRRIDIGMDRMRTSSKLVFVNRDFKTKEEIIRHAAEAAHSLGYVSSAFAEDVIQREQEFPTGLKAGVPLAIPHVSSHVKKSFFSVTTLNKPVEFEYMDGTPEPLPAEVVFVFGIEDHTHQVKVLQKLATMFKDKEALTRLKNAPGDEEGCRIIEEYLGDLITVEEA